MRRLLPTLAALSVFGVSAAAAQGLERGYADRTVRGPGTALGAVIYTAGLTRDREPITATPYAVDDLQQAGWDVFRFAPPAGGTVIETAAAALADAARGLRGGGYKRIALIGQSFGGWISLAAARPPDPPVDAVVAFAPAAFGARGDSPEWTANAAGLYPLAEAVTARHVLVFLFRGDAYDPGGRGARLRTIFAQRRLAAAVVDEPHDLAGHSAGLTRAFARRFGPCIRDFITRATADTLFVCPDPGPAALTDFALPETLQTVAPPEDADPALTPMAGRWYGAYATGRDVLFIVRRVENDRVTAVYAFGPVIRGIDTTSRSGQGGYTERRGLFDPKTGVVRFAEPEADTVIECRLLARDRLAFAIVRRGEGEPLRTVLRRVE
jgi:dienelactone hydrolase